MQVTPIKTKRFSPPKDDLVSEILKKLSSIPEGSILAITAKVVSIDQGRCVIKDSISKDELIQNESDLFLSRHLVPGEHVMHTITKKTFIPSAGIDTSNAKEFYILWPKKIEKTLNKYFTLIQNHYSTKVFGIIIVDSRSMPLRRGVVGFTLGSIGFQRLNDYRGTFDLFNKEINASQVNVPDSLGAAATFVMGEGNEQTPLALITDIPNVVFDIEKKKRRAYSSYEVPRDEDIYKPFLDVDWQKRKKDDKTE